MKKHFMSILFVFALLLLSSCSKETSTAPAEKASDLTLGKVSLRLDKENAPSGVSLVTAALSRADCDTLVKNLSMIDSSDAEILFESIKTGLWHLKIDAKNSEGVILYTGETNVQVEDSRITDVYLTLTPMPTGLGSVYIGVKWATSAWTDYSGNPVFTRSEALNYPYGGVSAAKVFFENGKYRMWYNGTYESARGDVQYAESVDGIHWHTTLQKPVLTQGPEGSWDGGSMGMTSLIKDEQGYKMYYSAFSSSYRVYNSVGLAVSQDGLTWEKQAQPVFTAAGIETQVCASGVVKKGSMYYMFYSTEPDYTIKMAESQDGIHWTRYQGNPVMKPEKTWELSGLVYPSVTYDGTKFIMIYENWIRSGFGMATSVDGINWTRDGKNPIFETRNTKDQWALSINYPFLFKNGDQQRIYYTGPANGRNNLGVALYQ